MPKPIDFTTGIQRFARRFVTLTCQMEDLQDHRAAFLARYGCLDFEATFEAFRHHPALAIDPTVALRWLAREAREREARLLRRAVLH